MASSNHEADLKGNIFGRPIHPQSLMAFGTEGDNADQKKPSLKMSTFTAHTYSVLALIFYAPGNWIWAKFGLENEIYSPPPGPSTECFARKSGQDRGVRSNHLK